MTVKEAMIKYLKDNGYGGLYNDNGECGCEVDDLMPCMSEGIENCECGYKVTCNEECTHDDAEPGKSWHIQLEKEDK